MRFGAEMRRGMIKLIASDVDGTLIEDSTPDLYQEMAEAIRELKKKGILFCAASGRQYPSLRNVFREVADDIAYIAENGAHICYQNKNISVTPMKRSEVLHQGACVCGAADGAWSGGTYNQCYSARIRSSLCHKGA